MLLVVDLQITSVFSTTSPTISPTISPTLSSGIVKGAPLYVFAVVVVGCILYGVVLTRLRDSRISLGHLKLKKACASLGLLGSSLTSELAFISTVFSYDHRLLSGLASLILIARLLHFPSGFLVLWVLFGSRSTYYLDLADKEHLLINRFAYIPLFILIFFDCTKVSFLPWLSTKFSALSEGYPDLKVYRMFVSVKIVQTFISTTVQISVLAMLAIKVEGGFKALSTPTQVNYRRSSYSNYNLTYNQ